MKKIKIFSTIDYILLGCVLALTAIGIAFIYSASILQGGSVIRAAKFNYIKRIVWAFAGLVLMVSFAAFDYRKTERYIFWVFIFFIALNVFTAKFGKKINGSRSWLGIGPFGIQPAEFSKIVFIFFLGWYFNTSENEKPLKRFLVSLGILFLQVISVMLQPDLGTALVFFPIYLFMSFAAGIEYRYIGIVLGIGLLTIIFTMLPLWQMHIVKATVPAIKFLTEKRLRTIIIIALIAIIVIGILGYFLFNRNPFFRKFFYWVTYVCAILMIAMVISPVVVKKLKNYQAKRIVIFIDPETDPLDAGWNILRAKTAIGIGGPIGLGFMKGEQSHKKFIPEQGTDFIFSILAEEWGFLGGLLVFSLLLSILLRIVHIIKTSSNKYGMYISAGIFGMFFFHIMENLGMVMGLMPITGIPLPFLSYGGSSLLTNMMACGTVMSVRYRRFNFM